MSGAFSAQSLPTAEEVLPRYFPERALRVLDCACGPAERVAQWRARGALQVHALSHGVPASPPQGYDTVQVLDLVEDELPFAPASLEFILCHEVLGRLRDPLPLLRRLHPLLTPTGTLVVTAANLQNHAYVLKLVQGDWTHVPSGPLARENIRFFTGSELLRLLQTAGYTVQRTSALRFDPQEVFLRDPDNRVRRGRIEIGPLSDDEYRQYLVKEYAFVAGA